MSLIGIGKVVRIANVQPQVNEGVYPAKAVVNEHTIISADIFTYLQQELCASVCIKDKTSRKWNEYPLQFIHNDHWEYSFYPGQPGIYQFKIQAWVNQFSTWKKSILKKSAAGQDLTVELQIGAELLQSKSKQFNAKEKKTILDFSEQLLQKEIVPEDLNFSEVDMLMLKCRDFLLAYPKTLELEAERKKAGFSTWYELFPRSTASEENSHGTFKDVEKLLPRISDMGFDVLYFPPIHPIGTTKRKGRNNALTATSEDPGSPWAIGNKDGGHKAIHKQLGTLKDFKSLVKSAGKLGIEIALDIAFQCSPDHPYVQEHPQWFVWRPDGTVQFAENPPKRYEDILPFNFESEDQDGLWMELKSVFDFWIAQGIRIFRIDNPHTKSFAFWEWAIGLIRSETPDVIFLAEAFTRPRLMEQLGMAGFNQSYTYFTWRTTKKELQDYMTELTTTDLRHYYRPNFWPNTPDILTEQLVEGGDNMHIIRLILAATLSSNYGIYGPVYEFGINEQMPGKEEYNHNEKYELKTWDWNRETRIGEIMRLINRIRKENAALQSTNNIRFCETSNDKIICYIKTDELTGNRLIIAVNLDPFNTQGAIVTLPTEEFKTVEELTVCDLLSLDRYTWQAGENFVQLNPHEMPAHVFRIETITSKKENTTPYVKETE